MNKQRSSILAILSPIAKGGLLLSTMMLLSTFFLLSGCGGGSGGGGSVTAVSGQAIDAPISNATITITLNAPVGQTGAQTLETTTADAYGNFNINVSFPNSSAPVFASAQTGTVLLTSYLGPASTLSSLSTLNTNNVPDLAISQVTTATLAILAATNSLGSLTPSKYAALLSAHRSDIIAAASGIMAVVDAGCTLPSGDTDTFDMDRKMVVGTSAISSSNSTPTLTSVSTALGSACNSKIQNLLQAISSSQSWAPELDLGDVVENVSPVVPAGQYTLQGLLADTGISEQTPAATPSTVTSPSILNNATVSVDGAGKISSTDGNISGQIYGNFLSLSLTQGSSTYSFSGKAGILPSSFLSGTTNEGFSLRAGGALSGGGGDMMRLDAVLVPRAASPSWTGISGTSEDGTGCSSGIGFRIHGLGPNVGGDMYNVCGETAQTPPVLSLTPGNSGEDDLTSATMTFPTVSMNELTSGSTTYAFILSASSVALGTGTNGILYYVLGSNVMLYEPSSSNFLNTFLMNENPLDKLAESSNGNSDH